jgi:hypothetical protein
MDAPGREEGGVIPCRTDELPPAQLIGAIRWLAAKWEGEGAGERKTGARDQSRADSPPKPARKRSAVRPGMKK